MKVSREKLQQIIQEELQQMVDEGELDEAGAFKALGAMGRSLARSAGGTLAGGARKVGTAIGNVAGAVGTQATKAGQAVAGGVNKAMEAGKQAKIKAIQDEIAKLQGELAKLQPGSAEIQQAPQVPTGTAPAAAVAAESLKRKR